jgi:hypothetical protein
VCWYFGNFLLEIPRNYLVRIKNEQTLFYIYFRTPTVFSSLVSPTANRDFIPFQICAAAATASVTSATASSGGGPCVSRRMEEKEDLGVQEVTAADAVKDEKMEKGDYTETNF